MMAEPHHAYDDVVIPLEAPRPDKPIFSWFNVGLSVPIPKSKTREKKVLLSGNCGSVQGGEIIAIMGGSGAGKSTLLNCLSGRLGPGELTGDILFNGQPRNKSLWKSQCAFVEQDDVMFKNLTVKETLMYSALLRLPSSVSRAQKTAQVNQLIMDLGLDGCKDVRIGNSESKGISGGERKRVAIGMELVTDPDILFLDEPTSGLDAFTAVNIISTIKTIAKEHDKIVILTIHQPRTDILELFDKILLLSIGNTIWYGPLPLAIDHFAKLGYQIPTNTNPSDYFADMTTLDRRSEELKAESLARIDAFRTAWLRLNTDMTSSSKTRNMSFVPSNKVKWPSSWGYEWSILFQRNILDVFRDKAVISATIGQSIVMTIIAGFVFFQVGTDYASIQDRLGILFFLCVNQTFSTVMPTINVFPDQKLIIKRERAAGTYRASSAFLAKYISALPMTYAGSILLAIPTYWMIGLQPVASKFFTFVCILLVHAHTAFSLGLAIGAAVSSAQVGQIVAPLITVLFVLFGGLLVNLDALPDALRWIQYLSIISYSNKALCQNEFDGLTFSCPQKNPNCTVRTGATILDEFGLSSIWLWHCVLINIGLSVFLAFLGYLFFSRTSKPLMRLKSDHPGTEVEGPHVT